VISLLRWVYRSELPLYSQAGSYENALEEIRLSHVSPQIYYLLQSRQLLKETPVFFQNALKQDYHRTMIQNLLLRRIEDQLLTDLDREGIPVIPLKGTRFSEAYFGNQAARASADIDLLIPPDDLRKAMACTERLGFQLDKHVHNHTVMVKSTGPDSAPLAVELHWTLEKQDLSEMNDSRFWIEARPVKGFRHVKELSAQHAFHFICLHGIRHRMDSMKFILDILQMLETAGDCIDYRALMEDAARDKTRKRVETALSIVYGLFPWLHEAKPLPFKPLETAWTFHAMLKKQKGIKDMEYYRYISYFKFKIFDTLKHTITSQKQLYMPSVKYPAMDRE
jgi:hypothetical protein